MKAVLSSFLSMLHVSFRLRASMQLEILGLRHQLTVLQRRTNKRPSLTTADRLLWVLLSLALGAVAISAGDHQAGDGGWRRKGFQFYWRWKSRLNALKQSLMELVLII